jgi:hypothetical protein
VVRRRENPFAAKKVRIDTSRIADRPRPEPPPDYQQLKVG